MTVAIDEVERRAIVKTLNALTVLRRERGPEGNVSTHRGFID
jgi:hypothetical protein